MCCCMWPLLARVVTLVVSATLGNDSGSVPMDAAAAATLNVAIAFKMQRAFQQISLVRT